MLNFFVSGINHECETISMLYKNVLLSNSSYMLQNINIILKEFGIKYCDIFSMNKIKLKNIINNVVGVPDWRCESIKELLSLRENQFSCELNPGEIASLLEFVSTER